MEKLGEHMMALRHDKRMKRRESLQQMAFGAALGLMTFGLMLLWALEVI